MPNLNQPTSHGLGAGAGVAASWVIPRYVTLMTIENRLASEVSITVDGTTPVVGADNEYLLPGEIGATIQIPLTEVTPSDDANAPTPTLQAIGAAIWSFWIQVDQ